MLSTYPWVLTSSDASVIDLENNIRSDNCEWNSLLELLLQSVFLLVSDVGEFVNVDVMHLDLTEDFLLEIVAFVGGHCVGFGD